MAEPTEADRTKAMLLAPHAPMCTSAHTGPACICGRWKLWPAIAQQLADERERARAPFLAVLAEHQPTPAEDVGVGGPYPRDMCTCGESFHDDCEIRLAFRRAVEETGQ